MKPLFRTKNKFLNELLQKANEEKRLTKLLKKFLDPELADHCKVLHLQKGCLTIAFSSAIWSTKFRYHSATLLSQLRNEGQLYQLRTIKTVIEQPLSLPKKDISPQQKVRNVESANIIQSAAISIKNEALRNALEKLAETLKK